MNQTQKTIERIKQLKAFPPFNYTYHESFDDADSIPLITAEMPRQTAFFTKMRAAKPPANLLPEIAVAYRYPLLAKDQEQHLFRKMNYYKHAANRYQTGLTAHNIRDFENTRQLALAQQELAFGCNYRLVIMYVKKFSKTSQERIDRLSSGSLALLTAINKFDFSRGFKFSTYACNALFNDVMNFSRGKREIKIVSSDLAGLAAYQIDQDTNITHEQIKDMLSTLSQRDRLVLTHRTGFEPAPDNQDRWKLDEVGEMIGLSKERVRQIERDAKEKLRQNFNPESFGLICQ